MNDVRINGKSYSAEKVAFLGMVRIKGQKRALRIAGGIILGVAAFMMIYSLATGLEEGKTIAMIVLYITSMVVGAVLLAVSFIPRNPLLVGRRIIEKGIADEMKAKEEEKKNR